MDKSTTFLIPRIPPNTIHRPISNRPVKSFFLLKVYLPPDMTLLPSNLA